MKPFYFIWLLFIGMQTLSQELPVSFTYARLTGYSSVGAGAFSFLGNTAALAGIKNSSACIYGERRFMLQGMGSYLGGFCLPSTLGHFGLKSYYDGGSTYNQTQLGLAYARRMDKIDLGLQFNYYAQKVSTYGSSSSLNFSLGAILHVTADLQAGFQIDNPVRNGNKSDPGKPASVYTAGIGWDASDKIFFAVLAVKTENQPVNFSSGIRYSFDKKLRCGLGFTSGINSFYCGGGVVIGDLSLDLTASLHPWLGITPGLMLAYKLSG